MMMNNRTINRLNYYISEVVEDIAVFDENTACAVIYEMINDVKTYTDYEIAETDPNEYRKALSGKKRIEYDKVDKSGLEIVNIVFNNEQIELMSLKEWLYLLTEARYPNLSIETIVVKVNMSIYGINDNQLSKLLNITRQTMGQISSGKIGLPVHRKGDIAQLLKFSMDEYNRTKKYPVIDLKR